MNIKITKGDLLKQDTDAIVNTVNCVGVMGKGIALQFKKKWPDNYKAYERACKAGEVKTGKMFVYDLGMLDSGKPEFIINFPTKNHWREKSKISYIEDGLKDLLRVINKHNIRSISIPPLGCGNGGLDWAIVSKLIHETFANTDISVRLFSPSGAPKPRDMVARTERPNMTVGRAILVKLISLYREMDYSLSRIEVQKLMYFAQVSGQNLKLNYAKNQFGPYADNLRHVLNRIDGHFIEGVGDNDLAQPEIVLVDGALKEAEEYLKEFPDSEQRIEEVRELIEGFETPYGMELLSTVHWVVVNDTNTVDADKAVKAVYNWDEDHKDWNLRKQSMMREEHIKIAWNHLNTKGWFN